MKSEIPPDRPLSSGTIMAEGPTVWSACLALLWCAFLLLACALATRFDEKRMVRSADHGRVEGGRQVGRGTRSESTEASTRTAGTRAPRHTLDMAAGRPSQ